MNFEVMSNAEAAKYVKGVAVHWYGNSYSPSSLLTRTHQMFPDQFILATEACSGQSGLPLTYNDTL